MAGQNTKGTQGQQIDSLFVSSIPPVLDEKRSDEWLNDLSKAATADDLRKFCSLIADDDAAGDFFRGVMDLSPFLRSALLRCPAIAARLFENGLDATVTEEILAIETFGDNDELTEKAFGAALRRHKLNAHIAIAIADIAAGGAAEVSVEHLTRLAETVLQVTARYLCRDLAGQGFLSPADPEKPEADSGLIILGMGKLGGRELNFSSDIDLIIFFEPEARGVTRREGLAEAVVKQVRRMVRLLSDRTADGYVFRTDLRLRPDPGATPLAIPVAAGLQYYESRGQNWERAAMIKARAVAGDIDAGLAFLKELRPFVWRRYLDFAAIADIRAIKRQIASHKGGTEIVVAGHNVKLGRGGIREVEFFVQTQQLIAGGRVEDLRGRSTTAMLRELASHGWIAEQIRDELIADYWFLRDVEHAIQMIADEQTHSLPRDDEELARVVHLLGFDSRESFSERFLATLGRVDTHFAALFAEDSDEEGDLADHLVFTGDQDDPGTLERLSELGFKRPADISRIVRAWHTGRYRALRATSARQMLTTIQPNLFRALAASGRPDETLMYLDEMLAGLPAGLPLFSVLSGNPQILSLLTTILATAPRMATTIAKRPHVFDGLVDRDRLALVPNRESLAERLDPFLAQSRDHEDRLDRLRIFAVEQRFMISARLLTGAIDATEAGECFTTLADLLMARTLDAVRDVFVEKHGEVPGGRVAILGMGRLGSHEMSAGSDLDIIFLYDHAEGAAQSDGQRPLDAPTWFTRLSQRLVAAVSAPTAEGVLYEMDLRLRPSGNQGPLATSLKAFRSYQQTGAAIWEKMALSRGRVVYGDNGMADEIDAIIKHSLDGVGEPSTVREEAGRMRLRISEAKPPQSPFDVKLASGGLIDLEFIAQIAKLTKSLDSYSFSIVGTRPILAALSPTYVSNAERDALVGAYDLMTMLLQILRICLDRDFDPQTAPQGFVELLCRRTDAPDLGVLGSQLQEARTAVRMIFDRLTGIHREDETGGSVSSPS
ncbi:bifunctional [glutamine synthetase] adenylyltransferase/[glutamine synthetase]-adenylyl-L-tyrosine phosphorylase [Notoacmeibacter sp. MSK16QG-6]|uniref:bifunctional [glutamine synthetase] adenylyltransferase/[glutamine synthetase]-adenylyl-L-tyrosine phosphorylase n=1 Tax=Notoacmeibacter sp. MSK16QG-6 TaxID=2957982 RepID=UPI0020A177C9|nr:bifunctional [glutamine synthetase] adenylyltransferase/[glutamine synthetase]-adenylyl-L-tyrosine phosphorylase [Notoacmeibacter sp. MSK16QG-6]MCP1198111.1 bifunctional [glutamine synthetase] adenylyltransferase/[glutamine synthetase]-adenylyl-L-tyrosine phosphorylase [Notoacmeibacter sp. MSK16QG-6]